MTNRVINSVNSLRSGVQRPQMSNSGVPVSFVDMNREPPENPDAPPPAPDMPDHPPSHLDPAPDEPVEDEDDRETAPFFITGDKRGAVRKQIAEAMDELRDGYMKLSHLMEKI